MSASDRLPCATAACCASLTAGSVDDGKSTLIGRLLLRHQGACSKTSSPRSRARRRAAARPGLDLSLLTDGLTAEREQGITIDVAYRYFATRAAQVHHRRHAGPRAVHAQHGHGRQHRGPRRDPGRRARRRRHADAPPRRARLLLGIRAPGRRRQQDGPGRLRRAAFERIVADFREFAKRSGSTTHACARPDVRARGRHGRRARRPPRLVRGPDAARGARNRAGGPARSRGAFRFPVQLRLARAGERHEHRGYLGRVESGTLAGRRQRRACCPAGRAATVAQIATFDGTRDRGAPAAGHDRRSTARSTSRAATSWSRARRGAARPCGASARAWCWLDERRSTLAARYWLQHATRKCARASTRLDRVWNVSTQPREPAPSRSRSTTSARARSRARSPIVADRYADIARPAASSSSTRRPTTRSPRG